MGQKVNPHGMRVGVIKDWDSRWYAEADFADNLIEDHKIRTYLKKRLYSAGVSKIEIERASDRVKIIVFTAKPGVVIGKGALEYWVAVVKPGRVMFEIAGVPEETAKEALRLAMHKLPCKCKIASKADLEGGDNSEN